MKFPEEYFIIPKAYQQLSIPASWGCCCNPSNNQPYPLRLTTRSNVSEKQGGEPDEDPYDLASRSLNHAAFGRNDSAEPSN